MIPVTKNVLNEAYKQLINLRKEVFKDREMEENKYKRILKEFDKKDDMIDNEHNQLNNIAEQLDF